MRSLACMSVSVSVSVSVSMLMACQPGHAQTREDEKALLNRLSQHALERLKISSLAPLGGPSKPCPDTQKACRVPIAIAAFKGTSVKCEAVAPSLEFSSTDPGNPPKRIIWVIDEITWWEYDQAKKQWIPATVVPDGEFQFHETAGISLTTNPRKQIVVGKRGVDDDDDDDRKKFFAHNKHKVVHPPSAHSQPKQGAAYVPVILFLPGKSPNEGNPTLCGAPDPLITNAP